MNRSHHWTPSTRWGLWLVVLGAAACTDRGEQSEVALQQAALGSFEDAGVIEPVDSGSGGCVPIDEQDTTCDGIDDDCDGERDEDCDFGPSSCPENSNIIVGTPGDDWLVGNMNRDCILGYGGDDRIWGLSGDDVLVGGPGDDELLAFDGDDVLLGGPGADELSGGSGSDQIDGGRGNDFIEGGSDDDIVHGGACNDLIVDASGRDELYGDAGSDRIVAGEQAHRSGGDGFDACDGVDDCELPERTDMCRSDADCALSLRCVVGPGLCVSPDQVAFTDPICDGEDDDCDGDVDEEYAPAATECGIGACAATGATACTDGTVVDSCTPGTPAESDQTCDGVDDDCNRSTDEDFPGGNTVCGVGACASQGELSCVEGTVVDSCTPGTPAESDATCDGVDDDCDGSADEHYLSVATSCGVGACAATGATACVEGAVVDNCTPGTPAPSDPSCDGSDDDCDGLTDEDYQSVATTCEVSGCLAEGATACVSGEVQDSCLTDPVCIAELACGDGLDNDGDGFTDCDDDPDCTEAPACQVQEFALTVVGNANIWGAGHASAPVEGVLPPGVMLELGEGAIVTLPSVTGIVIYGSGDIGPDGIAGPWSPPDLLGIAGYSHATRMIQLAAVFLGPDEPTDPAPPRLSFEDSEFTELAPEIEQIFVVGDGRTSTGELQQFIVPEGATRVFIGITDMCGGSVGCYGDNSGSYQVQGEVRL